MGGGDLSLKVILACAADTGPVKGFGAAIGNLSGPAGLAAKGIFAIVGAAVAFTAASVQMASQYQAQMNMVQALTGSNTQQMAYYDAQVKALAISAGEAPTKLAAGLYNVLSASYSGSDAMRILTLATQDAKIGLTSAAVTSNALTNVLRTFGMQVKDATRVNGEMLQTVTLGKATFEQYASNITKAASSSKQFHVSMETMNAAWATLTSTGISAGQATTDYTQLLGVMYANIGTVSKSLAKNGIAFNEAKFNAMSFGDKVQYLNSVLQEANQKHVHITGVTKQAAQAIQAISGHIGNYSSNLAQLSNKQAMAQKTQQAWAITQGGFSQTMSRVQAAVQVLMITIGAALLPVLTRIAQAILPAISNFTTWLIKSGALQNGMNLLVGGVKGVIGFVAKLVEGGAAVVNFFKNNQVAALALLIPLGMIGAVLVNLAVGAIVGFIASLPAMISGFALWAAGAWTAAAGTIAATWPLLAIGAAIAIVIAIIILLWTHWSSVTAWLKTAWQATVNAVVVALKAMGAFFTAIWQGIIAGLTAAWNWVVNAVKMYLSILWAIWTAPFRAIAALFTWLYSHNTYFKKLIDKIREIVQAGLAWLRNAWNVVINWLAGVWHNLSTLASNAWNAVKTAVMNAVIALGLWEIAQWNKAVAWLAGVWNGLKDLMKKAWAAVSGVISGAWNMFIVKPLQMLWKSIVDFANGWPKQAVQWGIGLIQGFINGIASMLGKVKDAATNIIKNVASILGFHSPAKEGEGRYIIQWGQGLVAGFSSGVLAAVPALKASVAMAVKTGISPMSPPALAGGGSIPYGRPPTGNSYSSTAGGNTHNGDIVIHAPAGMNIKQLADEIERRQNSKYRRSGVMGNPAYGARDS